MKSNHIHEGALLNQLGQVSRNLIGNHHLENLSEFFLHELCSRQMFDISKAAYLVNNPDFVCLKGVAGYDKNKSFVSGNNWHLPKDFTQHMKESDFNNKVRALYQRSLQLDGLVVDQKELHRLADYFEIENPVYQLWNMKHANHGLLIFQKPTEENLKHEYLMHFTPMFSFCSVF